MTASARREQLRPVELVGFAMLVAAFLGVVVVIGTREPNLALIFAGIGFIVTLLLLAMFALVESRDRASRADADADDHGHGSD